MVVLHHSVLAYYAKGPLPAHSLLAAPRWWQGFPIVDPAKWSGFTPFILFNDSYTMALLFLVSGLFSWPSLKRKGAGSYWRDRMTRLGLPLLLMCAISPAAYYATYLQSEKYWGRMEHSFWHQWFTLQNWPAGPAWFLMALLLFDGIAIALYKLAPSILAAAGSGIARIRTPSGMVLLITLASSILYVPALLRFGPYGATRLFLPLSRVLHDLAYFLVGLALGSSVTNKRRNFGSGNFGSGEFRIADFGMIEANGRLAAKWASLLAGAAGAFALWQAIGYLAHRHYNPLLWGLLSGAAFCLSCSVSVMAALATFLHFVKEPHPAWNSLLACSLGIYAIHYPIIAWIQLGAVSIPAPGWFKGLAVFAIAFPLCWATVWLARRSRMIARII